MPEKSDSPAAGRIEKQLASTHLISGRADAAVLICNRLLERDCNDFEALCIAGAAHVLQDRHDTALPLLERAAVLRPHDPNVMNNLALALQATGESPRALVMLQGAAAMYPQHTDILFNLAGALQKNHQLEEAASLCARVISLDPGNGHAYCSLGNILREGGNFAAALAAYQQAVLVAPRLREARKHLAFAQLQAGDFRNGWDNYEARSFQIRSTLSSRLPRWDGRRKVSGDLWLVAEQGLGDTIQFVRYARLLRDAGIRASLECHPGLVRILRSNPFLQSVVPYGQADAGSDAVWFPMQSLPRALGTDVTTIPTGVPYLGADPERVALCGRRFAVTRGLRVGIAWQGDPRVEQTLLRGRSVPLAEFAPLVDIPGISLYSLQKGYGTEQLQDVSFAARIVRFEPELDTTADAFMDTAAVMMHLDLVVTSDTAIAHLAGALGRPVWLALQFVPEWRWLLDRADSPWYPTMRLFRQPRPGNWAGVFAQMAAQLGSAASAGAAPVIEPSH
jgi:Flp pilus assembly protein TadD